jgi:hypothetical protein
VHAERRRPGRVGTHGRRLQVALPEVRVCRGGLAVAPRIAA